MPRTLVLTVLLRKLVKPQPPLSRSALIRATRGPLVLSNRLLLVVLFPGLAANRLTHRTVQSALYSRLVTPRRALAPFTCLDPSALNLCPGTLVNLGRRPIPLVMTPVACRVLQGA